MNAKHHCVAVAGIALLAVAAAALWQGTRGSGPQDVCEVVQLCDGLGLFWSTGATNFPMPINGYSTLTISTEPITIDEAANLSFARATEQWRGKARAYHGRVYFGDLEGCLTCVAWGKVTLIGDRDLVERLAGRRRPHR